MELVIANSALAALRSRLFEPAPAEAAAFLAVEPAGDRLLVRSSRVFEAAELDGDGYGHVAIDEGAQLRELVALQRAGHSLVEVHTHPGSGKNVCFSTMDEQELPGFARYVQNKLRGRPFGALVLGEEGYDGRGWTSERQVVPLRLRATGEATTAPHWLGPFPGKSPPRSDSRFDRQLRALGPEGQARIAALHVGVVGLGGTGSQVVQQLAHLGVRQFVLVEDDRVEASNLPRLAGATRWDVALRRRKTAIARRAIRRLTGGARIRTPGGLRRKSSLSSLAEVDLIIGCVDNDGARLILSELASAQLIPYLDVGVGVAGEAERSVGGRIGFLLPGGPCLACADELDFAEAAEDLEAEQLRSIRLQRGYAREREVEPALMPLNTVLVGAAMIEFLAYVAGLRPTVPFIHFDAMTARFIPQRVEVDGDCVVCRPSLAMGARAGIDRYALD